MVIYKIDRNAVANEPIIHRIVGIVRVSDWKVSGIDGTIDCFTEADFNNTFIPYVKSCQEDRIASIGIILKAAVFRSILRRETITR